MARKRRGIVGTTAAVLLLVFAAASGAQEPKAGKTKGQSRTGAKKPVIWAADELKWTDPAGAPPGVKSATLWGDPAKGPHGALQKFVPGFSAPLHTHSSDFRIVVVSGTLIHGPEGGPEKRLKAGSYLFLPSTYKHTTRCDAGSECVFLLDANGKFDVKMVGAKKPAAKK